MTYKYAILGAGMQGPAVAYDLARFGDAEVIYLADIDETRAIQKAEWINQLLQREVVYPKRVDAADEHQVRAYFEQADVVISAVPWQMNMRLIQHALEVKRSFIDMGNDPEWFWHEFRKRDEEAKKAHIALVPDCGLAPGMVNHLGLYCMEQMDECHEIRLRCGGLPQRPIPPIGYKLVFNMIGVISEYTGKALTLHEGELHYVPTMDDVETLEIEPLGVLEAAPTSGGTSTAPYTLQGKVREYDYKTLRYPGHWAAMRALRDLGFFRREADGICTASTSARAKSPRKSSRRTSTSPTRKTSWWSTPTVQASKTARPTRFACSSWSTTTTRRASRRWSAARALRRRLSRLASPKASCRAGLCPTSSP
jgi:lysine 6-dehydrogenase